MCNVLKDFAAKVLIVVVSSITLVLSLALTGIMVYLMVGLNITEMLEVFGSSDLSVVMYALYGFLGAIFLISLMGIVGVCCKSKVVLALYSFILMICLLGMGIIALLWILEGQQVMDNARTQMEDTLNYEYEGDLATDPISIAWNLIQVELQTCGVTNKTDYESSNWYNASSGQLPTFGGLEIQFPVSCCEGASEYVSISKIINKEVTESAFDSQFLLDCYGATNTSGTITYDRTAEMANANGSLDEVKSLFSKSIYITAGVIGGLALTQLLLIWAGCRLIESDRFGKDKKVDDSGEGEKE